MCQTIIFPFQSNQDNKERYLQTMRLADKSNAKVVLFTCIPTNNADRELDQVYYHLLELYGYFQAYYYGWHKMKIPTEKIILRGDFAHNLKIYLYRCQQQPLVIMPPELIDCLDKEVSVG